MATLGITVKSDFSQASQDLKNFKATSESTEKSIKKFQASFKGEQVDRFLDKQKLASVALKATRGDASAAQAEYRALQRQIEKLIKRGLDPQDKSLQKLTTRYAEVGKEVNKFTESQKKAAAAAKKIQKRNDFVKNGLLAVKFAAVAAGVALVALSFDAASGAAKFSQAMDAAEQRFGVDAELMVKSLKSVSDGTVSNADLISSANKAMALNVTKDIGQMTKLLEVARLRGQALGLDTATAFNDLATGIGRASPLILDNLGIITKGWNEQAKAAGVAFDSQFILNKILADGADQMEKTGKVTLTNSEKLQQMSVVVKDLKLRFGAGLLPVITGFSEVVTTLFKEETNLNDVTRELVKSNREYKDVTKKLADESANLTDEERAKLQVRKAELKLNVVRSISLANRLFKEQRSIIPKLRKDIEQLKKTRIAASKTMNDAAENLKNLGIAQINSTGGNRKLRRDIDLLNNAFEQQSIKELELAKRTSATNEAIKTLATGLKLGVISVGDLARLDEELIDKSIELAKTINLENDALAVNNELNKVGFETKKEALEALSGIEIEGFTARIEALNAFNNKVLISNSLTEKVKKEILKKSNKEISKLEKLALAARVENFKQIKDLVFNLASEVIGIFKNTGKKLHSLAIAEKAIAIGQATVNTALAVTSALKTGNIVKAFFLGFLGAAQITKIATTTIPKPSAQTGTGPEGLLVRNTGRAGQDNIGIRANQGETVDVRTRGDSGSDLRNIDISIDRENIFSVIQDGINNGDINITDDNIQVAPA